MSSESDPNDDGIPSIVVVGAPRSGTKIIRDTLAGFPEYTTWPCDEIPAIWKHGNLDVSHDALTPRHATPDVRAFIRSEFAKRARRDGAEIVVEKTCANALRVPFVDEVLPKPRFIHLVRDGRDAVPSATKRWTGGTTLAYTLRKARFVPLTDIPRHAASWLTNRLHRLVSEEDRVQFWGPRFEGIEEVARKYSLLETCAHQWTRCVEKATADLSKIESSRVLTLYYEDFVTNTAQVVQQLSDFLDEPLAEEDVRRLSDPVHDGSIGKGREQFEEDDLERIEPIMEEALRRHGYR